MGVQLGPTFLRTHPTFLTDHHRHRFVHHFDLKNRFFLGLNQGTARVGKGFGILLNFFDHQTSQRRGVAQNFFQLALLLAQLFEFLLNFDGFEPGQLPQADFQNVFGLPVRQVKAGDQGRLGVV